MGCLSKLSFFPMVHTFHQLYPTYIHALREAAQKYCKMNKVGSLAELHEVCYRKR